MLEVKSRCVAIEGRFPLAGSGHAEYSRAASALYRLSFPPTRLAGGSRVIPAGRLVRDALGADLGSAACGWNLVEP